MVVFENVSLSYGKGKNPIFSEVNFNLRTGAFCFITGASGAGKSSILKLIYLGLKPSSGKITLFGATPNGENKALMRRKMGVVFQDCRLIPHLSTLGNAMLPLRVGGINKKAARTNAMELLKWVGLSDRLNAMPDELAGGEAQRVAIVRAVISKPDLLIADEPTGNVDAKTAEKLLYLFRELNKSGTTVLIATHNRELLTDGEVWQLRSKTLLRMV